MPALSLHRHLQTYPGQRQPALSPGRYKELLRDRSLTIGRLDASRRRLRQRRRSPDNDPSFYARRRLYRRHQRLGARGSEVFARRGLLLDPAAPELGLEPADRRARRRRVSERGPYIGRALRENSGLRVWVESGLLRLRHALLRRRIFAEPSGFPTDGRIRVALLPLRAT